MSEEKMKHLEFIQAVITRMANNSFLLKGWCITLIAAIFALSAKDANCRFIIIAFLPIGSFWILDAFYLYQERLYRLLYDEVALSESKITFTMNTQPYKQRWQFIKSLFSKTLVLFYLTVLFGVFIVAYLILSAA